MWSTFFLLFAALGNSHVIPRDNLDLRSLEIIERDIQALTKAGIDYEGGFLGALAIERAESRLVKDLKSGTDIIHNQQVNLDDSDKVVTFLKQHLEPNIEATTAALVQKHVLVEEAGMSSTVHGAMVSLKNDVDKYFSALVNSLEPSKKGEGVASWMAVDQDINRAIRQFGVSQ